MPYISPRVSRHVLWRPGAGQGYLPVAIHSVMLRPVTVFRAVELTSTGTIIETIVVVGKQEDP